MLWPHEQGLYCVVPLENLRYASDFRNQGCFVIWDGDTCLYVGGDEHDYRGQDRVGKRWEWLMVDPEWLWEHNIPTPVPSRLYQAIEDARKKGTGYVVIFRPSDWAPLIRAYLQPVYRLTSKLDGHPWGELYWAYKDKDPEEETNHLIWFAEAPRKTADPYAMAKALDSLMELTHKLTGPQRRHFLMEASEAIGKELIQEDKGNGKAPNVVRLPSSSWERDGLVKKQAKKE